MALALFDDERRTADVLPRLNKIGKWSADVFQAIKAGAHVRYEGDLERFDQELRAAGKVRPGRRASDLDDSTVARELLAAARSLADRPAGDTRGLWPRAAVLLARQSLEVALKTYWSAKAPGVEEASMRAQLLCLGTWVSDEPLARRAHQAWSALSERPITIPTS